MVLHHVAQRARAVVKLAALFHTQLLGNGNLHGLHEIAVPHGFEENIAETQRQHVLQAFFAQIMVDAVNLLLLEILRHIGIDLLRRGQIGAQRFFQHNADVAAVQADFGQMFARGREKFGRGGKVNHHVVGLRARLHGLCQLFKIGQIVYIDRQVLDAPDKTLPHFFVEMRFDVDFAVAVDFFQEVGCVEFAARYTQNAPFGVQ